MKTAAVHEILNVEQELALLGLEVEPLRDVVRAWLLARSNWTPNYPRIYKGYSAWAEAVRKLRDWAVSQKQWTRSEDRNYPLTISPTGEHCIAITSGDVDTGMVNGNPKNKVPKGRRTAEVIEQNNFQQSFEFGEVPSIPSALIEPPTGVGRTTRIFLICVDDENKECRSELSLPMSMNGEGVITAWKSRIILPAVPFDGYPLDINEPKTPDLDIEIRRRA